MRFPGPPRLRAFSAVFVGAAVGALLLLPCVGSAQETHPPKTVTQPDDPPPDRPARSATLRELRATHRYDPAVRQTALEDIAAFEGVVRMDPFPVHTSRNQVLFERYLEERRRKAEAKKPSLANGVQVPGLPERVEVGIKPYKDELPFGSTVPRWSIINLRF